jgi:hypothetical protein
MPGILSAAEHGLEGEMWGAGSDKPSRRRNLVRFLFAPVRQRDRIGAWKIHF